MISGLDSLDHTNISSNEYKRRNIEQSRQKGIKHDMGAQLLLEFMKGCGYSLVYILMVYI